MTQKTNAQILTVRLVIVVAKSMQFAKCSERFETHESPTKAF
jgi:hypothetical protein